MRPLLFSVLLGTLFSVSAFAQTTPAGVPPLQVTRPIYAWKTETDVNKSTGRFNHCLVKNMYDNGTVLMVAENYEGVKRLALNFPQEKMKAGEHFDLTLQVDKRDVFPVEAVSISPQILTIGIPDALPDQMRKGQAIYLRGPNDEVVYTLDGVDGAITALQDCITTQKGQGGTQTVQADIPQDAPPAAAAATLATPPMAEQAKPAASVASPLAPVTSAFEKLASKLPNLKEEKKIEIAPSETQLAAATKTTAAAPSVASVKQDAKTSTKAASPNTSKMVEASAPSLPDDLKDIYRQAGLTPTSFIATPDKDKTSKRPLDYAWIKGTIFVGLKEQNAVPENGIYKASVYYLSILKQRCTGPFVAEAGDVVKTPAVSWLVAEAACSPGTKDDTIAALLFANDAKHLRVYFFESPAKDGAQSIKARDAVLKAIRNKK